MATAAVIAGFGAAVLIYGPIGSPYRQLTGTSSYTPPVGVTFGTGQAVLGSQLPAPSASQPNVFNLGGYSNASSVCNASGVFSYGAVGIPLFSLGTGNITSGNTTYVCLNSVGANATAPFGIVNSTWNAGLVGGKTLTDLQGQTYIPEDQNYSANGQNVASCNNFTAPAGSAIWQSSWNLTHINNGSFTPCNTFYQMNSNTTVIPSFDGVLNSTGKAPGNSSTWVINETGYLASDVVYEVPVNFNGSATDGLYQFSVDIGGVTPVAQVFNLNYTGHGLSNATVVFVFDMTAAWLFDASYSYNGTGGVPSNSTLPEIYGAIGLVSMIVTECASNGVCPVQT